MDFYPGNMVKLEIQGRLTIIYTLMEGNNANKTIFAAKVNFYNVRNKRTIRPGDIRMQRGVS